jgi:hypothetical protein
MPPEKAGIVTRAVIPVMELAMMALPPASMPLPPVHRQVRRRVRADRADLRRLGDAEIYVVSAARE